MTYWFRNRIVSYELLIARDSMGTHVALQICILVSIFVSLSAWNLAVQFKDSPEKMRDFFVLSFKVFTLANSVSN